MRTGSDGRAVGRVRRNRRGTFLRLLAALFALMLLSFPGSDVVDLVAAVQGIANPRDALAIMRAGYGLLVGFVLPAAFFVVARDPELAPAALGQVFAGAAAFLVAAVSGAVWAGLVGSGALVILGAILLSLVPDRRSVLRVRSEPVAWPLLALASIAAAFGLPYALAMSAEQRSHADPYEDFTLGVQGWSALCAFVIAVVVSAFVASFRLPGWRSVVWTTGAATAVFGVFGIAQQQIPGSPGLLGGVAAVTWAMAFIATAHVLDARRSIATDPPGPAADDVGGR